MLCYGNYYHNKTMHIRQIMCKQFTYLLALTLTVGLINLQI